MREHQYNKALHPTAYSFIHFVRASLHSLRFQRRVSLSFCHRVRRDRILRMNRNKQVEEHFALGNKYFGEEPYDIEAALREFHQVVKLAPKWAEGYICLSNALVELNQLDEAIAACREAMRLEPKEARYPIALGFILILKNDCFEAIEVLRKGIELKPQHFIADAHLSLAKALMETGQVEEARKVWQIVAAMEPEFDYKEPHEYAKRMLQEHKGEAS